MVEAAKGFKGANRTELLGNLNASSYRWPVGQAATAERLNQLGKDPMMHS